MKKYIYLITVIILILSSCLSFRQCNTYKHNLNQLERKYVDSVSYFRMKDSSQLAILNAYDYDLSTLKTVNKELYKEIDNLKLKAKNVKSIVKYQTQIKYHNDTTYILDTISNIYTKEFDFSDRWRTLKGTIQCDSDTIGVHIDNAVYANYSVTLDKNNQVYIHTDNPYVQLTQISGWTKPKERTKRWGIGPFVGITYDAINNKVAPTFGIGISYDLIRW